MGQVACWGLGIHQCSSYPDGIAGKGLVSGEATTNVSLTLTKFDDGEGSVAVLHES